MKKAGPEVRRGTIAYDKYGKVKVMVVQDGWAMVRRPGYIPFVVFVKDFWEEYTAQPQEQEKKL